MATLLLLDISSSQGVVATLDLDDTISTSPIPIFIKYKPNVRLFEFSTNETGMTINVIAVHRLEDNVYKMWENDNGSVWLWDFLPPSISDARIGTFEYNYAVAFSKSVGMIEDKAFELLLHLSDKQRFATPGALSKSIVLICHSLGGIVVKRSVICSHEHDSNQDYKDILENTRGNSLIDV